MRWSSTRWTVILRESIVVEEAREAEEKVPFYKREISFGRKRATSEESLDAGVVGEDEPIEIAAQVEASG